MKKVSTALRALCLISLIIFSGCYFAPPDTTGQSFVDNKEFQTAQLLKEGLSHARENRFVDAEFRLRQALYISPDAEAIKYDLAIVLLMSGQQEEAEKMLRMLYEQDRLNAGYRLWYAQALSRTERFSEALSLLVEGEEAALSAEQPRMLEAALFARARSILHFEKGNEAQALCASSTAFAYAFTKEETYRHARLLLAEGYAPSAQHALDQFLGPDPTTIPKPVLILQAVLAYEGNNLKDASDRAKEAFLMPPPDYEYDSLAGFIVSITGGEVDTDVSVRKLSSTDLLYFPPKLLQAASNFSRKDDGTHWFKEIYYKLFL